jgi:NADH pyrophosphatase NudC (nudix superfamily)
MDYYEALEILMQDMKKVKEAIPRPCEDCINRQDALNAITMAEVRYQAVEKIEKLPPVIYKPKEGRWIMHTGYDAYEFGIEYSCSECNDWNDKKSRYCPNCGAKMQGV